MKTRRVDLKRILRDPKLRAELIQGAKKFLNWIGKT